MRQHEVPNRTVRLHLDRSQRIRFSSWLLWLSSCSSLLTVYIVRMSYGSVSQLFLYVYNSSVQQGHLFCFTRSPCSFSSLIFLPLSFIGRRLLRRRHLPTIHLLLFSYVDWHLLFLSLNFAIYGKRSLMMTMGLEGTFSHRSLHLLFAWFKCDSLRNKSACIFTVKTFVPLSFEVFVNAVPAQALYFDVYLETSFRFQNVSKYSHVSSRRLSVGKASADQSSVLPIDRNSENVVM